MDTSVFALDMSAWLSWTSDVLYVASLSLALLVIVIVSCLVGQSTPASAHSDDSKRRTHPAH